MRIIESGADHQAGPSQRLFSQGHRFVKIGVRNFSPETGVPGLDGIRRKTADIVQFDRDRYSRVKGNFNEFIEVVRERKIHSFVQKHRFQSFFRRLLRVETYLLGQNLSIQGKVRKTDIALGVLQPLMR
jgi:hypothetical protein